MAWPCGQLLEHSLATIIGQNPRDLEEARPSVVVQPERAPADTNIYTTFYRMRLFGRGKKKEPEGPQESIVQMRATLEMLEKKEKHLETKIVAETATAKQYVVSNKSMALMALKRKKMYEQQREHTRGARFNLETQMLAIENANVNMETLKAMKTGSATMKTMHGALNVDKVDATMDDIREQMDLANEINAAISTPLGMDYGLDEDELDEELEQLEQSELEKTMLDVKSPAMPARSPVLSAVSSVEEKSVASLPATVDEDAELEELRASMAL